MIKKQSTELHITTWRSFASQISTSRFDLEFLLGVMLFVQAGYEWTSTPTCVGSASWGDFIPSSLWWEHPSVYVIKLMSGLMNSLFWVCLSVLEIFVMKIFVLSFCLPVHCGEIVVVVKTILWDLWKQIAFKPRFLASRVEKERRAVLSELQMMNTIEYRVDCQVWFVIAFSNPLPFHWSELQAKVWLVCLFFFVYWFMCVGHDIAAASATACGEYVRLSISDWVGGANQEVGPGDNQSFSWAVVFSSKCHFICCWRHWQCQPHFGNDWGTITAWCSKPNTHVAEKP